MHRLWMLGVIPVVAAATLIASCADNGGDNGGDARPPESGATAQESGVANGDGEDVDELQAVAVRFGEARFRGEYTLTGAAEDDFGEGTLVMYKDGAERIRFDLSAEQDGETTEIVLIETPDASAFCLRNAGEFGLLLGIPEGDGVCFNDDPSGGGASEFSNIVDEIEAGGLEIVERSERTIAGEDAACYRARNASGETSDICFSDDAFLLAAIEPDGSGIEATGVSDQIEDGDFELPYEVSELPGFEGEQ